jgi:hypothetical protein
VDITEQRDSHAPILGRGVPPGNPPAGVTSGP